MRLQLREMSAMGVMVVRWGMMRMLGMIPTVRMMVVRRGMRVGSRMRWLAEMPAVGMVGMRRSVGGGGRRVVMRRMRGGWGLLVLV